MLSLTSAILVDCLKAFLAIPGAAPIPATAKVKLYVNDVTPTPSSVVGDFTECTATGYASLVPTWGTAFVNAEGFAEVLAGLLSFVFSDGDSVPFTLFGYYITVTGGGTLLAAERLDAPIAVNRASQPFFMIPRLVLQQ